MRLATVLGLGLSGAIALSACAHGAATAQTLDSARTFTSVHTDSTARWYTRVPPPVHDTTHDTTVVIRHDTLPVVHDTVCPPPVPATLASLATARRLTLGTMVTVDHLTEGAYKALAAAQFTGVTPGNELKFGPLHPGPTTYTFTNADSAVGFGRAHGMVVHGHTLVWDQSIPAWVTGGSWTRTTLLAVLKDHITTVVSHFAGQLASWDVVNEAQKSDGTLKPDVWLNVIGPDYIDSAFVWARRADPSAALYLNEFNIEAQNRKSDSVLALVTRLRARGVPIDGVGFQAHSFPANPTPSAAAMLANFSRFAAAGFALRVSELDVMVPDTSGAVRRTLQGAAYRDVLSACLAVARCTGVTVWGSTDTYSWIPASWPGWGRGLPFDSAFHAKPAADSLMARLGRVP